MGRFSSTLVEARESFDGLPLSLRAAILMAALFGWIGGLVGLMVGLAAYPPTAWAAVFEVGLPAAFVGFFLGGAGGGLVDLFQRLRR
jgi:hypothetical protein